MRPYGLVAGFALMVAASTAAAQDIFETMAQGHTQQQQIIGNGIINRHRMDQVIKRHRARRNPSRRQVASGVTDAQIRACAGKARLRMQHGAADPRIRFLYEKCAAVGL